MHNFGRGRLALSALVALALTGFAAGCGGDDGDDGSSGPVELTIATFNEFGYEGLIEEWNAAHPDIQVTQKKVGTWDDAKDNLYTKLAAGSGLSDIEAIEVDDARDHGRVRRVRRPDRPGGRWTLAGLEAGRRPPTRTAS